MFNMDNANAIFGLGPTLGSFIASRNKAKSDRKWQAYNNKMTRLQDAVNQNALTTNEIMRKGREHAQLRQIQMSRIATRASAEVAAAATGTTGRSVNMTLFDVDRNANRAAAAVAKDSRMQDINTDHQRLQSAMQTSTQLDLRSIPNPSPTSVLLGLGEVALNWK